MGLWWDKNLTLYCIPQYIDEYNHFDSCDLEFQRENARLEEVNQKKDIDLQQKDHEIQQKDKAMIEKVAELQRMQRQLHQLQVSLPYTF